MSREMNDATLSALLQALTPVLAAQKGPTAVDPAQLPPVSAPAAAAAAKPQKRCGCCTKKLTLTDFDCPKCKARFCGAHRLPELHACPHDFRKEGQAQLAAANPRVVADKIDRI